MLRDKFNENVGSITWPLVKSSSKDLWKCIFLLKRINIDTIPIKVCVFCNAYLGKLSTIMTWQIPCMISNCQEPILVKQTIYRCYNNCLFLFLFRMSDILSYEQWFLQAGSVRHEETTARRVTQWALAEKKKRIFCPLFKKTPKFCFSLRHFFRYARSYKQLSLEIPFPQKKKQLECVTYYFLIWYYRIK